MRVKPTTTRAPHLRRAARHADGNGDTNSRRRKTVDPRSSTCSIIARRSYPPMLPSMPRWSNGSFGFRCGLNSPMSAPYTLRGFPLRSRHSDRGQARQRAATPDSMRRRFLASAPDQPRSTPLSRNASDAPPSLQETRSNARCCFSLTRTDRNQARTAPARWSCS